MTLIDNNISFISFFTWGRSVRASNPKNVMVRTVVTPEILNRYYVRTLIYDLLILRALKSQILSEYQKSKLNIQHRFFIKVSISQSYGRDYLHYKLKPCNLSPNSL